MNDAAFLVAEYSQRKRMAELGFSTPLSELSAWKSEAFGIIDAEIHKLQNAELKKKHGKRK